MCDVGEVSDACEVGTIVSVAGYLLTEYVLMVGVTFALLVIAGLARCVRQVIEGRSLVVVAIVVPVCMVVVAGIYALDVRIGVVMFVNGIVATVLVMDCVRIVSWLREGKDGLEG